MTQNQVNYAKILEERRANRANEKLMELRDARSYEIAQIQAEETARANRARESLNLSQLEETKRANLASEALKGVAAAETARHNQESEQQGRVSLGITASQAAEVARSNAARERETERSNRAREIETNRSNVARETETSRSNRANESLKAQTTALGYAQLAEQRRLNTANISLGVQNLAEQRAHHESSRVETLRHNVAAETEATRSNRAKDEETNRANLAKEALGVATLEETARHNKEYESTQRLTAWSNLLGTRGPVANLYNIIGGSNNAKRKEAEVEKNRQNALRALLG